MTAYSLHPGVVQTELWRHLNGPQQAIMKLVESLHQELRPGGPDLHLLCSGAKPGEPEWWILQVNAFIPWAGSTLLWHHKWECLPRCIMGRQAHWLSWQPIYRVDTPTCGVTIGRVIKWLIKMGGKIEPLLIYIYIQYTILRDLPIQIPNSLIPSTVTVLRKAPHVPRKAMNQQKGCGRWAVSCSPCPGIEYPKPTPFIHTWFICNCY